MNPLTINFSKPSLDLVQHLIDVFPGVPRSNTSTEKTLRMQGQREVIEYIARLAAPPGEEVRIKETITRVYRPTQDAQAGSGLAPAGSAGHEGAAVSGPSYPTPQSWGGDESGIPAG